MRSLASLLNLVYIFNDVLDVNSVIFKKKKDLKRPFILLTASVIFFNCYHFLLESVKSWPKALLRVELQIPATHITWPTNSYTSSPQEPDTVLGTHRHMCAHTHKSMHTKTTENSKSS